MPSCLVQVLGCAGTVSCPQGCGSGSPQTFLYNALLSFSLKGVKLFGGWVVGGKAAFTVSMEERVPCHSQASASLFLPQRRIKSQLWLGASDEKGSGSEGWSREVESGLPLTSSGTLGIHYLSLQFLNLSKGRKILLLGLEDCCDRPVREKGLCSDTAPSSHRPQGLSVGSASGH